MAKFSIFDVFKIDELDEKKAKAKRLIFSREFSGSMTPKMKRLLSSRFITVSKAISHFLSHVSTKVYGALTLSFGLFSLLMYFMGLSADNSMATPIIAAVVSLISIPFLLSEKTMPIFLQSFAVTDYVFFEFFCMKRHNVIDKQIQFPVFVAVLVGFIPALISIVLPLWQVLLIIGVVIFIYASMESPEFAFFMSLFALPYLGYIHYAEYYLGALILLATISFLRKVFFGKRVICLEHYEVLLCAMLLFVLISGVFVKGMESFSSSISMIVFALGYILACNLITNSRLAERAINSIVFSCALAAIVSVVQYVVATVSGSNALEEMLVKKDEMVVIMIIATLLDVGMIKQAQGFSRWIYAIATILCATSLIVGGEFFALPAIIISPLIYLVIKSNRFPALLVPLLIISPLVILILPNSLLNEILFSSPSISSAESLFELWGSSLKVFSKNLLVGIGIGSDSFVKEMAEVGISGYPDSSNMFIEIGLEAGIFALISFILILVMRVKHSSEHYLYVRNSPVEFLCRISETCLLCLVSFGMFNYIWSDVSAYYLFWCIFGIGSAMLRVAKKDFDDKVLYYDETSAQDASVIDVMVV